MARLYNVSEAIVSCVVSYIGGYYFNSAPYRIFGDFMGFRFMDLKVILLLSYNLNKNEKKYL